jgi:hypothetical protein
MHRVEFTTEARTDDPPNYRSGYPVRVSRRLTEIIILTYEENLSPPDYALDWRYVLDYEYSAKTHRSLLRSVTLYEKNGTSLPPKRFAYHTGGGIE